MLISQVLQAIKEENKEIKKKKRDTLEKNKKCITFTYFGRETKFITKRFRNTN
jgi:hypothetical protein